ncbi:MAG: quinol:cytochrome C oxidoreductase [Planctomycetes bacterium]|nr:quinol:cytochrome C oxidoreductase [Planctomycetota bacterium]
MSGGGDGGAELLALAPLRSAGLARASLALILCGAVLCATTLLSEGGLERFSFAYLWGFSFAWAIVLGSLFFVALQHVTRAVWSVVIRRVAEALAAPAGLLGVLFAPVLLLLLFTDHCAPFPWSNADLVRDDHVLQGKAPYLNVPFFVVRALFFFACWGGFAAFFVRQSLKQDAGGGAARTARMRRVAAPFLILFALTVTFASFDWLMSQDPHWYSTMYGVYVFAGMALAALAAITLAVLWLRARGLLGQGIVSDDHLYSLGGLLFAFTCFWAYIAFSQFMLVWYGNLPEETVYFARRGGAWLAVALLLVALRFALPFFLLLSRDAKRSPRRLVVTALIVLAGELLDLYWLIMPQLHEDGPRLGWQELGPPLFLAGALLLHVARFLGKHRPMAVGDPFLSKSCAFHL